MTRRRRRDEDPAIEAAAADRVAGAVSVRRPRLGSRLVIGAIAGFVGTMAMTAAMRRLHRRLPKRERYPLTPREIIDSTAEQAGVEL